MTELLPVLFTFPTFVPTVDPLSNGICYRTPTPVVTEFTVWKPIYTILFLFLHILYASLWHI